MKQSQNCSTDLGTFTQFRAPKEDQDTSMPRYINGKLESSRMRYLLVGVSSSIKNESKMQQKVAWGRKNGKSRSFSVSKSGGGGGSFWVKKTYPSLSFKLSCAGSARPGELTCIFF